MTLKLWLPPQVLPRHRVFVMRCNDKNGKTW